MKKLVDLFTILVIIFMSGVFFVAGDYGGNTDDIIKGNIVTQVIKALIYFIVFGMLIVKRKHAIRLSIQNISIWVVMFWVCASIFWSEVPSMTLRSSVALLGTTLIGIFIAVYYNEEFENILGWSLLIMLLLSLIVIIFFPSQGIMSYYGTPAWQGIMSHKNSLARISLFGIIIFPVLFSKKGKNAPWLIGFLLSIILLIGSKSASSIIISLVVLLMGVYAFSLVYKLKISLIFLILLFLVVFEIGLFVANNLEFVLSIFGRDSTLTGRIGTWQLLLNVVRQSPWLGHGYGAIYLGNDYGPIADLLASSGIYSLSGADNGYLDLTMQIGLIGVALVFIVLFMIIIKSFLSIRNSTTINYFQIWPVIFLSVILINNFTESMLLTSNSITWIILTVISFRPPKIENL